MNCVVDNSHSELSIAFYRELGFVKMRICCPQAPWAIASMMFLGESDQVFEFISNSEFLIFFS